MTLNGGSTVPAPDWLPNPPEMCGQCTSCEWKQTFTTSDPGMVTAEFACQGCGYIVTRYGFDPAMEDA